MTKTISALRFWRILANLAVTLFTLFDISATLHAKSASPAPLNAGFNLIDTDGKPQRLDKLKGKWVVVNFWATWCAPCVKEIPDIAEFAKEQAALGDRTRVIGIAVDWDETGKRDFDEKKIKAFAKKLNHHYPLVLADDKLEKVFGKIKGMPTTIIYDPDGEIAYKRTGTVTKALLTEIVSRVKAP